MKKPHTLIGYKLGLHIDYKLRSISRPIEKMLYYKDQIVKKAVKKKLY